ncbi:hypothetical protein ACHAWF_001315 [Thalassiosira exigua]
MSKLEDNHQHEDEEYSHQQTLAVEYEKAREDPKKEYSDLKSSVVRVKREIKSKVDKLVQIWKARTSEEDSVYSGIDLILLPTSQDQKGCLQWGGSHRRECYQSQIGC